MIVKQIKITKVENGGKLLAYAIIDTDTMRLWDVKVLEDKGERIVSLPTKRKERNGVVTFHPYIRFNQLDWDTLKEAVLVAYDDR